MVNWAPPVPSVADQVISWLVFFFGLIGPIVIILGLIGIRGFMEITRFEKGESVLYKISPLTKLILVISTTIAVSLTIWWFGAILALIYLLLFSTLNNPGKKILYAGFLTFSTSLGVVSSFSFYTPYYILTQAIGTDTLHVIWYWPSYFVYMGYQPGLTLEALYYGFQVAFRFIAPMLSGLLLIITTTPSDVLRYLEKVKFPLVFIFALTVAMRSIPRIFDTLDTIVKLQMMRGLGYGKPKALRPFYLLLGGLYGIVPTLIFLMRQAKYTAIAADTRGFNAMPKRTYMKPIVFTQLDYIAIGLTVLLYIITAILLIIGLGRGIPYIGF
ncbi:hypothetical protein ATY89_09080 [Sulfolobus acidocaldarius]|uniref:Conserved protein n=4 Tax=Sulfolobus acidocaldarius TaxID=2285 RepID=Q4J7W3_SULAC|nr:conserved protein [Sulfolobus acidocaldarius DSM 639]AGE71723.1 hypothetical protein SacN8_08815 [Sulfolobus acidocaldarius N8]ALU30072.1 hypothetical protein ATY89_09080 [Sulfolobus acidocaldarius]ALU30762.1 hypothetical protein ATZ20_00490 [Sulfolobus acidocaldarius]WCM36064.1 energy-coupling factor transporter transmembrane protein EcfT [Sulfolobus acidocaldarius DSM 639]